MFLAPGGGAFLPAQLLRAVELMVMSLEGPWAWVRAGERPAVLESAISYALLPFSPYLQLQKGPERTRGWERPEWFLVSG